MLSAQLSRPEAAKRAAKALSTKGGYGFSCMQPPLRAMSRMSPSLRLRLWSASLRQLECVATTGVAGPDGGTEENPVGTVWVAVCSASSTVTEKSHYKNDRERNIQRFSASALNRLRLLIARENPE